MTSATISPKALAHIQAEAVFKKSATVAEGGKGSHEYEARLAAQLANMDRLRAERLARDAGRSAGISKSRSSVSKTARR